MVIANILDVHPLADRRTVSRTVETDGNASEIPKHGIILPSGGLDSWKNTRKKLLRLTGSVSATTTVYDGLEILCALAPNTGLRLSDK
jgi:hypothetical protein